MVEAGLGIALRCAHGGHQRCEREQDRLGNPLAFDVAHSERVVDEPDARRANHSPSPLPILERCGRVAARHRVAPDHFSQSVLSGQDRFRSIVCLADDAGSGYSGGGSSSYANLVGTDLEDAQKKLGKMGFKMQKPVAVSLNRSP